MKKILIVLLLPLLFGACSKTSQPADPEIVICFGYPAWLQAKMNEYSSCTCLTGIRQGVYKDQAVFEIYGFDPLCNGVNVVYKSDGTQWFISGDKTTYDDYTANVKQQTVIWTCSKGGK